MKDRKKLEKDYHNTRFTSGGREKADRNYVIATTIRQDFDRLLDSICHNKKVLEIGCAGGGRINRLVSQGNRVAGIDLSEAAIAQARASIHTCNQAHVELLCMDAENLSFSQDSFDIVFGSGILHHLDLAQAYRELHRVLRPEGSAFFVEPLGHNSLIKSYRRKTPSYRTETEHPLLMSDLVAARQYFEHVSAKHYYLFTILAIPFARTFMFQALLRFLETVDRVLFTLLPFLKRYSWMVLLTFKNPRPAECIPLPSK